MHVLLADHVPGRLALYAALDGLHQRGKSGGCLALLLRGQQGQELAALLGGRLAAQPARSVCARELDASPPPHTLPLHPRRPSPLRSRNLLVHLAHAQGLLLVLG